jgi:tetratricopeptide (TPR) repeat protein
MNKQTLSLVAALVLPVASWAPSARAADRSAAQTRPPVAEQKVREPKPGQLSTLFPIDDSDPESSVPKPRDRDGNPLEYGYYIQDLVAKAEAATKRNDHEAAVRYYRALAASSPDHAKGWSRLCEAYQMARDRKRAMGACKYAIEREGAELNDFARYVELTLATDGPLAPEERTELAQVIAHLDKQPDMAVPAAHLRCKAAVKLNDAQALEACTSVLAKAAPEDPKTVVFQWSLAVMRGQRSQAGRLVERAKQVGVAEERLQWMRGVSTGGWRWSSPLVAGIALGVAAAAALLVLLRRRVANARAS